MSRVGELHAAVKFNGGGGGAGVIVSSYNIVVATGVVRTGAGVYTATMDDGIDGASCAESATAIDQPAAGTDDTVTVEHTSDTVLTIRCFRGGVASDAVDASITVFRTAVG